MPISDSQKGRAVEQLVGATLMLQADGALRVSLPLVDDEGVDLIVGSRRNDRNLLLQVKSRFSLSGRGRYRASVRRATCSPDPNKFLLFVYYDRKAAALHEACWLVRASQFCELLSNQRATRPVYVFDSTFTASADMWASFRQPVRDVATTLLEALE